MKATVVRSYSDVKKWTVELKQGVQSFRLDLARPKRQARWFADMFELALKAHDAEKK